MPASDVAAPEAPSLLQPTQVKSIAELPGKWYRPFTLPGQISYVSFESLEGGQNGGGGSGQYTVKRSCGLPFCFNETGEFHAVPMNPAVGFAFVSFNSDASPFDDTYIIDAMWRSSAGKLVALQLRRMLPGNLSGTPFLLYRIPGTVAQPAVATPVTDDQMLVDVELVAQGEPSPAYGNDTSGVYVRSVPLPGEMGALTLSKPFENAQGQASGSYQVAYPYCLPWCFPETGSYALKLTNAILGTGRLELQPAGGQKRSYRVHGIWRTPTGTITGLALQRLTGFGTPAGAPFSMLRQLWGNNEVSFNERAVLELANDLTASELVEHADLDPEMADAIAANRVGGEPLESVDELAAAADEARDVNEAGLCAYYESLELYYRTRALQCAYSACFPLSSWYGFWADYYHQRAEAVCGEDEVNLDL